MFVLEKVVPYFRGSNPNEILYYILTIVTPDGETDHYHPSGNNDRSLCPPNETGGLH